jgi:hypothetical protein
MKSQNDPLFLSEPQIDQLTGILRGRLGKTKHVMQCDFLRQRGIAHFVNVRGRPVIPMTAVNGQQQAPVKPKWQPTIAR